MLYFAHDENKMAYIDKRNPCKMPGCPARAEKRGYCSKHQQHNALDAKEYNKYRRDEKKSKVYYSNRWRKLRKRVFGISPLCVSCLAKGNYVVGVIVDHLVPFTDENDPLAFDIDNLYPVCRRCHNIITPREKTFNFKDMTRAEAYKIKYGGEMPKREEEEMSL